MWKPWQELAPLKDAPLSLYDQDRAEVLVFFKNVLSIWLAIVLTMGLASYASHFLSGPAAGSGNIAPARRKRRVRSRPIAVENEQQSPANENPVTETAMDERGGTDRVNLTVPDESEKSLASPLPNLLIPGVAVDVTQDKEIPTTTSPQKPAINCTQSLAIPSQSKETSDEAGLLLNATLPAPTPSPHPHVSSLPQISVAKKPPANITSVKLAANPPQQAVPTPTPNAQGLSRRPGSSGGAEGNSSTAEPPSSGIMESPAAVAKLPKRLVNFGEFLSFAIHLVAGRAERL